MFNKGYILQNWLDTTSDYVFFKDLDGVYREISNSLLDLLSKDSREEVIGKTDFELYPDNYEEFLQEDRIVKETGINYISENWVNHKKYGKIFLETQKAPLYDANGRLIGIQGSARDNTNRYKLTQRIKERESQLDSIFETLPAMIWLKDLNNNYILTNDLYREFFKAEKGISAGRTAFEVLYTENITSSQTIEELKRQDEIVLKTKSPSSTIMFANTNDGPKWVEIIKSPVMMKDGSVLGILGIGHDITESVNYEKMMGKAKDKAEAASKAKSAFLANISHEIRTPMNGILGFVQLLESTTLDEEQSDYLQEIKKSSQVMLSLLNNVLDLAKAESGKMTMESIPFNVREVMDDVAALTVSALGDKQIDVYSFLDSKIQENLIGDPLKLKQVLSNLCNNSVKFTESGRIEISAELLGIIESELEILFKIQDTGVGIKKENLNKVFEAFEQADSSTTRKYGGTGLGLPICKNIVKRMGGELKVKSTFGVGTAFEFTAKFKVDIASKNPDYTKGLDLSNKKIIIANTNPFILRALLDYLHELKAETIEISSSKDVVDYLQNHNDVDLFITDYLKDGNSNFMNVTVEIKRILKEKQVPLILGVSRATKQRMDSTEGYNIKKIIVRPAKKKAFLEAVVAALE